MMPCHGARRRRSEENRSILPSITALLQRLPSHDPHPSMWPCTRALEQKTAGEAGRRVESNLTLFLGLWQLMDLIRCHVDLHVVADAVELPIGNNDHVTAKTEKATNLDSDRGDFPAGRHRHTVDGPKVGPIR